MNTYSQGRSFTAAVPPCLRRTLRRHLILTYNGVIRACSQAAQKVVFPQPPAGDSQHPSLSLFRLMHRYSSSSPF